MTDLILWYLFVLAAGWMAFPIAFRLLPALPERGYTASRALGLLLWGYIYWLLNSLGILQNNPGSLLFAWLVLAALSAWALRGQNHIRQWLRQNRGLVLVTEMITLAAFIAWAIVRAANPEALGTEKPMELAFINAILGSPSLPPHDPWLSGYSISYYYFGYVIVAMLAKISGISGGVAFNLSIALIFALSASGAYGLVYNLLAVFRQRSAGENAKQPARPALGAPLLGPVFLLLVSNLEGFLHSLHNRGVFWSRDSSGALVSGFWRWLDILNLNEPPPGDFSWVPNNFWWWWRASRVLQDYNLKNSPLEIIDEFPFFSYLLGDLHPHVLAMPFGLLAIALALNVLLGGAAGKAIHLKRNFNLRTLAWLATLGLPLGLLVFGLGVPRPSLALIALGLLMLAAAIILFVYLFRPLLQHGIELLLNGNLGRLEFGKSVHIAPASLLFLAVILGGMAFMNTWDFPFYVALGAAAYAIQRAWSQKRPIASAVGDFFWLAIILGISGGLLYLPFYLGFSSQAGGILPNLVFITRGAHLWVMFAPLLIPILGLLIYLLRQARPEGALTGRAALLKGLKLASGLFILMFVAALLLGFIIVILPEVGDFYMNFLAAENIGLLFQAAVLRRLASPGGWITLLALFTLALAALLQFDKKQPAEPEPQPPASPDTQSTMPVPSHTFAILLILLGALLVLGPEFFYLRDQFGWRMNTIFKFYYQAWLLWSIAAAYASAVLLHSLRRAWGVVFRAGWAILLVMSLVYLLFSVWNKTNGFNPQQWTLDSSAYINSNSPDEAQAIEWLKAAPYGVLAEAVPPAGGSYTEFARFATLSGKPGVLGWFGHESQWRGGGDLLSPRQADLEKLYCSREWSETQAILNQYQIRYIIIGSLERNTYRAGEGNCSSGIIETKFSHNLKEAFKVGQVTIYEYPIENR